MRSPESVHRLRRFILDLAVRGKLVPQDPEDEPAAALLQRIAKEKMRLVKAGEIKKNRAKSVCMAEAPFELPRSWKWAALGDFLLYDAGTKREPDTLNQDRWLLELEDVEKDTGRLLARIQVSGRESKSTKSEFRVGDILYGKLRPYLNKVLVADEPGYSTTEIVALRPYLPLCSEYCALALRRPDFVAYVTRLGQGTKMPRLRTEDAIIAPFPLPPLPEQQRIVAKVDELMGLCDRLEAEQTERETTRTRLTAASLTRLTASDPDEATFREHAAFALDNFASLTARPEQAKALRRTILNLAVRGKLVPQDPEAEPAAELLKRIAKEKTRLVKAGKIRKQKAIPPLTEDELPSALPTNWQWTQIAEIGLVSPRNEAADDLPASFIPMPMIPADYGATCSHEVRQWGDIKKGYTHFAEGDVGLAKITPCFQNGKSVVFRNLTGGLGSGTTELHIIRPLFVEPDFIILFLKCPDFIETGIPKMTGTAGQKRLPAGYFAHSPFPLPPLAEQRRIVAKVDELMAMCNRLEGNLNIGDEVQGRAVSALLHKALDPRETLGMDVKD